jgi:hypothetical protein
MAMYASLYFKLISRDLTIEGYKIPKGVPVQMMIYSVLRGKKYSISHRQKSDILAYLYIFQAMNIGTNQKSFPRIVFLTRPANLLSPMPLYHLATVCISNNIK